MILIDLRLWNQNVLFGNSNFILFYEKNATLFYFILAIVSEGNHRLQPLLQSPTATTKSTSSCTSTGKVSSLL